MRAIVMDSHGGPEVLRWTEVDTPVAKAGQALVRVEAAGVNFVDVYHRTGLYKVDLPFIAGQEGAGVVTAVGDGVNVVSVGDRVAFASTFGAYAEFVAVPADKLVPIPEGVDAKTACVAMVQGITAHYLTHATYPLQRGETILCHAGAGGVGLLLTQIARELGAIVITTVSTADKEALSRQAGAHYVIRYTEKDFVSEVRKLAPDGVSVVYDSVGKTTFMGSLECIRPRGLLALFGASSGAVPPFDPTILSTKGSLFLTRPTVRDHVRTRQELLSRTGFVFDRVRDGRLHVRIGHEYALAEAAKAHRDLEARLTTGKIVLIP
jgi:NADPH:quinone reductase